MNNHIKVKSKRKELSFEERMAAEFKHLRLRIKRLEQLVLVQKIDNGVISKDVVTLKKG